MRRELLRKRRTDRGWNHVAARALGRPRARLSSRVATAWVASAVGAFALGALALGSVAVAAIAIGSLKVGRARVGSLEIDELHVRSARGLPVPPPG